MQRVVVYRCFRCGGARSVFSEPGICERTLACSGQLDVLLLLRPFEAGDHGVCVFHCRPESCETRSGCRTVLRRIEQARRLLVEVGVNPERIRAVECRAGTDLFAELKVFKMQLKSLEQRLAAVETSPEGAL